MLTTWTVELVMLDDLAEPSNAFGVLHILALLLDANAYIKLLNEEICDWVLWIHYNGMDLLQFGIFVISVVSFRPRRYYV